jgi:hypothetical protein
LFEQFEHRQSREEIIMNIEKHAPQLVAAQQAAIKAAHPSISYTFTGAVYVDSIDRAWHEATANGEPCWLNVSADYVRSNHDIDDIEQCAAREPREATLGEVVAELWASDKFEELTAADRLVKLQPSETAGTLHLHVFRSVKTGRTVYVRGWRDSTRSVWLSVAESLDYWA